jgi:hypothetical protein
MSASYFLGTQLLATTSQHPRWTDADFADFSQVFICPTCGAAWGRVMIPNARWAPVTRGCPAHPFLADIGGSFIAPWRSGCPAELPPEVLHYEASIRLNQESER